MPELLRYDEAKPIADRLAGVLAPFCDRVEIVGSVRRKKPEGIKDVELCVLPRFVEHRTLLEDIPYQESVLEEWLQSQGTQPEEFGTCLMGQPSGKYLKFVLPDSVGPDRTRVQFDLFVCSPENWGLNFLIRTGSAEFTKAVARRWKSFGYKSDGAILTHTDGTQPVLPEEADVFRLLRLEWVEPEKRRDATSLKFIREGANAEGRGR